MRLKVCLIQMCATNNKEENLRKVVSFVEEAVDHNIDIVGLPEMFNYFSIKKEDIVANAEYLNGTTIGTLKDLAKEYSIYIHAGSIFEISEEEDKVYNTSVILNPQGKMIGVYRKIHLAELNVKNGVKYHESEYVKAGNEIVTIDINRVRFGLTICRDIRFPELYRKLTLLGAEAIWVPAAFPVSTGKDHWEILCRARAIENQVYILAPAQIGKSPESDYINYGRSLIVDPWGIVITQAPDEETIIISEIDIDRIYRIREQVPVLNQRRPDLYGL